jgi:hypothetical protein
MIDEEGMTAPRTLGRMECSGITRKLRHTTHLDGFPDKVKIVRNRHPLQGQLLEVIGWTHRNDILHLTLILPDGSRSFIPAYWTNFPGEKSAPLPQDNSASPSPVIATTRHLLQARKIVDALLCKFKSSEHEDMTTSKEENDRAQAIGTVAHIDGCIPNPKNLASTDQSTKTRTHHRPGPPDQQNGLDRGNQSDTGATP